MDVDWQEHLRWVRVEDRWMNLVDIGSGPPLIFIHGLSGCWQNWLEQIPHFARDHRVIALDLPGFGQSEMPAEEISISNYADTIDALMTELGIDTARIVGNSMGGFIAAEAAIKYPHRVERLVLVAAAGISLRPPRIMQAVIARIRSRSKRTAPSAEMRVGMCKNQLTTKIR